MPAKPTFHYAREWYEVLGDKRRYFFGTPFYFDNEAEARRSWNNSATMTWVEPHYHDADVSDLTAKVGQAQPRVLMSRHPPKPGMDLERFRELRGDLTKLATKFGGK